MPGRMQYTDLDHSALSGTDPLTGETWRFSVVTAPNGEVTITRGRLYQLPSDWTHDSWTHYWDADQQVAIYDDSDYESPTFASNPEDTERAITAYRWNGEKGLARVARRLATEWGASASTTPAFIPVGLDRGVTLYALSWDGDPEGTWRDEIEAVHNGDIWRCEVQEYVPWDKFDEGEWQPADDVPEEWYGEAAATAAFVKEFELDEFPADRFAGSDN